MTHNLFNEQLVKRSPSAKSRLIQVAIGVLAVLLCGVLALEPSLLSVIPVLLVAIIIGAFVLIRRQNVEYEYTLNDAYLEIDKIFAKSSRKNVASVELTTVEFFAKVEEEITTLKDKYQTVYDCAGDVGEVYGIAYPGVGEEGKCILLFTPNEKMLDALHRAISPRIWKYNG